MTDLLQLAFGAGLALFLAGLVCQTLLRRTETDNEKESC